MFCAAIDIAAARVQSRRVLSRCSQVSFSSVLTVMPMVMASSGVWSATIRNSRCEQRCQPRCRPVTGSSNLALIICSGITSSGARRAYLPSRCSRWPMYLPRIGVSPLQVHYDLDLLAVDLTRGILAVFAGSGLYRPEPNISAWGEVVDIQYRMLLFTSFP
jgi:hypothetical protein